jgi:hypothetical protein
MRGRRLTVSYLPALWHEFTPRPEPLPYLRLRGRWLEEAGFPVGAQIRVRVEPHRLILEVIDTDTNEPSCSFSQVHEPEASAYPESSSV